MKRCTQTHMIASFGEIPEGSLWADDSPYLLEDDKFEDVADPPVVRKKSQPVRKFGQTVEVEATDGD